MNNTDADNFAVGFIEKCAELGVDPKVLIDCADRINGLSDKRADEMLTGGLGYLTSLMAPFRAAELHSAGKLYGVPSSQQPFSIRHPYLTPTIGYTLGGMVTGPRSVGTALSTTAALLLQQRRVNKIMGDMSVNYPELHSRLKGWVNAKAQ